MYLSIIIYHANIVPNWHSLASLVWQVNLYSIARLAEKVKLHSLLPILLGKVHEVEYDSTRDGNLFVTIIFTG